MSLPPEIRDEIAGFLMNLQHRPSHSWSNVTHDDHFYHLLAKESPFRRFPRQEVGFEVSILLNLRLVCRDWHQTATVLLRQHCWWPLKFDYVPSLERALDLCLASDTRCSGIAKLDLTDIWDVLTARRAWEGQWLPDTENPHPKFTDRPQYKNGFLPREDGRQLQMHYDKTTEHRIMRGLFDNLGRIHGLSLAFPGAAYEEYPQPWAECYDSIALDEVAATVQYGLASAAFEHLVQLRLQIPCTRDMHRFTHTMLSEARGRLRHFDVCIVDETDDAGNSRIENTADWGDDVADGMASPGSIPASNLQSEFPNRAHQTHLWDFVASCANLESLSITATHYLDLDQLNWPRPSQSRGLRALSLDRVWTSIPSIIALLRPNLDAKGPAQLRFLYLQDVKVYAGGGNWSDLFAYLGSDCPDLALCVVKQLTYFSAHPNYESIPRIWEDYREVWSLRDEDVDKLRDLTRQLVRKAGGRGMYSDSMEAFFEEEEEDEKGEAI
ncbi:hypothetical protein G7Z17_g503 [Cylindrodendrum hubeiense]|uniref:Uncharacterized protein n=1 Tax=Cylindrodendrum hubeiense TaxID=595255 RepID=A0A9P5HNE7_9HYPO|nr:hypothetical protein G7Z17_g503 [Cylindrodendrum hubeiense]